MDLRVERTKRNITNAFITMRAKKPIEKITVKEISDLAFINKATFYHHYKDIYDLSDKVEDEIIKECLATIEDPDIIFKEGGVRELTIAFLSQNEKSTVIFSGSRAGEMSNKIHKYLCKRIMEKHPEFVNDIKMNVLLDAAIHGSFHAFIAYRNEDFDTVIESLSRLSGIFFD